MTTTETAYTIEELTAMPDDDLNALAAGLRNVSWEVFGYEYEFDPTNNRNQSFELLQWATAQGIKADACFRPDAAYVTIYIETIPLLRTVPGNTARAETIAFCAAMLAMAGRLK